MPGTRFNFRLSRGPFAGSDCRFQQIEQNPDRARVQVRGSRKQYVFPLDWIVSKGNHRHVNHPKKVRPRP